MIRILVVISLLTAAGYEANAWIMNRIAAVPAEQISVLSACEKEHIKHRLKFAIAINEVTGADLDEAREHCYPDIARSERQAVLEGQQQALNVN